MPGNPIKEENLKTLRKIMRQERVATKAELSKLSGISVVTIQSLMQSLLSEGEVFEDRVIQPKLGRPAASYRYNELAKLVLVICMYQKDKQDTASYMVYNLYGECITYIEETLTDIKIDSYNSKIEELLQIYSNIVQIGFGMPAVAVGNKLVISDYKNLLGFDFCNYIQDKYNRKVFIENDINAAIFGFWEENHTSDTSNIVGIYLPENYPPGAGVCQSGKIIKGQNGFAGEIKYLPYNMDWESPPFNQEKINEFLVYVVRVMMCMYNPEKIVIYSEQTDFKILEKLQLINLSENEIKMLPEIKYQPALKEDFIKGMKTLALKKI